MGRPVAGQPKSPRKRTDLTVKHAPGVVKAPGIAQWVKMEDFF